MAKLLITATYGYDNSTRATMPFFVAKGASEAGIDVGIVLALDATVLVKPELRKHVQAYGQPALEELFQFAVDHRIPVYVGGGGARTRGVLDADLERIATVQTIDVKRYAQLLMEYDRSVSFGAHRRGDLLFPGLHADAARPGVMNVWHLAADTPRHPRRVTPGRLLNLAIGTWPIEAGQDVIVEFAVVARDGQMADGRTRA